MSLRLLLSSTLAVSAVALSAVAADQPAYAPPAPWVDVAAIPPPPPEEGAPAIQFLVEDHQSRLDPAGDAFYSRSVVKILKPEGLTDVKSLGVIWSPDTETITFHTLNIIRGDQVIDLLTDHAKMLVLRRETNLEQASLDGRITASRQIDGLQTGDVLDFSYTRTHADPVVKGHSFANDGMSFPGVAGRYRATISWPKGEKVQWKTMPGFGDPKLDSKDGRTVLVFDKTDAEAPKAPIGAPLRFYASPNLLLPSNLPAHWVNGGLGLKNFARRLNVCATAFKNILWMGMIPGRQMTFISLVVPTANLVSTQKR